MFLRSSNGKIFFTLFLCRTKHTNVRMDEWRKIDWTDDDYYGIEIIETHREKSWNCITLPDTNSFTFKKSLTYFMINLIVAQIYHQNLTKTDNSPWFSVREMPRMFTITRFRKSYKIEDIGWVFMSWINLDDFLKVNLIFKYSVMDWSFTNSSSWSKWTILRMKMN